MVDTALETMQVLLVFDNVVVVAVVVKKVVMVEAEEEAGIEKPEESAGKVAGRFLF